MNLELVILSASEESRYPAREILRFTQDDKRAMDVFLHYVAQQTARSFADAQDDKRAMDVFLHGVV